MPYAQFSPNIRYFRTGYVLIAWILLNILINLNYPAQNHHIWTLLRIVPEIWGLLAILCLLARIRIPFHPVIFLPLTGFIVFLRLFRFGEALMPMYFNRDFNLYMDARYLPDLMHLLYNTVSLPRFIVCVFLFTGGMIGVSWGIWYALKMVYTAFRDPRQRLVFTGLSLILVVIWLPGFSRNKRLTHQMFAPALTPRIAREVNFMLHVGGYKQDGLSLIREAEALSQRVPSSLEGLRGANVYLFLIESYGYTVFADQRHATQLEPLLRRIERQLQDRGFHIRSHFMTAATYGGASWLSHATLATGVRAYDQMQYNLALNSRIKPLAAYFNEAGYRTISVKPNTEMPWPEGEFFQYQRHYYAWDFEYRGPRFGWATMPDQFVLDYIFRQEIQQQTQSLFIEYALVSSHAPFHEQPPYVADWSQIGDGAIYHTLKPVTFPVVWPDLSNATEAFTTALRYDWQVLAAYLTQYINDDALIILLGDHQPNVQITGENSLWSVPIHVISRNPHLVAPFEARGYLPGLIPTQPLPHPGMENFLWNFLEDFQAAHG